jgi:hypothetical protein
MKRDRSDGVTIVTSISQLPAHNACFYERMAGKWRTVTLLALAELLAMSVWLSASVIEPQLTSERSQAPSSRG